MIFNVFPHIIPFKIGGLWIRDSREIGGWGVVTQDLISAWVTGDKETPKIFTDSIRLGSGEFSLRTSKMAANNNLKSAGRSVFYYDCDYFDVPDDDCRKGIEDF